MPDDLGERDYVFDTSLTPSSSPNASPPKSQGPKPVPFVTYRRAGDEDPDDLPRAFSFGPIHWGIDARRFLKLSLARESHPVWKNLRWYGIAFGRWAVGFFVLRKA